MIVGLDGEEPDGDVDMKDPDEVKRLIDFKSENSIGDLKEAKRRYSRARDRGEIAGARPRAASDPFADIERRRVDERAAHDRIYG